MTRIKSFSTVDSLRNELVAGGQEKSIGFVPTMGALHSGHLSLVEKALTENDRVVVSIFVNPAQFNDPADLKNYPRTLDRDIGLLSSCSSDILLFVPDTTEIYPEDYKGVQIDLGRMDKVMEGLYRQGHFDGVVRVVYRLFEIVRPHRAYFGLKDYQQVAVITHMVKTLGMTVEIIACEIVRTAEGLAESSRNERLSDDERTEALILYESLQKAKELFGQMPLERIRVVIEEMFRSSMVELEYFELVDTETLENATDEMSSVQACVAAKVGRVRLIDNLRLEKSAN